MKPLLCLLAILLFAITACYDKVTPCGEIGEIPHVFSPVLNDKPDYWTFDIRHMESWKVSVYGRWGNLKYEAVNKPVIWSGELSNGDKAPEGTYFYKIEAQDGCGEKFEKQGTVTLIR